MQTTENVMMRERVDFSKIKTSIPIPNLIEIQKAHHHLLDLMFFSAAVSDHSRFDGKWRIFGHFKSGGRGSQHGDSAHLTEL